MKPNGFAGLMAALVVCVLINVLRVPASQAQLIGCSQPTGPSPSSCIAATPGPMPGEQFTDISSGIFTYSKTDMSLPGPMPINVTRVYRSGDQFSGNWLSRAFGVGTSLNYDMFLYSHSEASGSGQFNDTEVVMPDGGQITCAREQSTCNSQTDCSNLQNPTAVFTCNQQPPGVWFGSTITYNTGNSGWDLLRLDGTTFHFGYNSPLQTITDRHNNQIQIVRGGQQASICKNAIPSNSISTIWSSNGRSVSFCYDDPNYNYSYAGGISAVTDNTTVGKLVTYTYNSNNTLATVTQTAMAQQATTTYTYNGSSPSGPGNITKIVQNYACSGTNCSTLSQFSTYVRYVSNSLGTALSCMDSISSSSCASGYGYSYDSLPAGWTSAQQVHIILPDQSKRTFIFDQCGYVTSDERSEGNAVGTALAEYTVFARGQQPIGSAPACNSGGNSEFVGEVQEQNSSQQTVRQTTYQYDGNGNVTSTTISPQPGVQDMASANCCSSSATWNYTYTTFNRLATAVEPMAFNDIGTRYVYNDTASPPNASATDPLGQGTTVTYNQQGQPTSVTDSLGNSGSINYFANGDVESAIDPTGEKTSYETDPDGRIMTVISPLNETTTYNYDALDDVTDIYVDPNGLNLHTNYTYDLIGEIASETTSLGDKTTYTRSANLTKLVVKDARGFTTTTNVDSQGGATDYTDERGDVTSYVYDPFGRISVVGFNGAFDVEVGFGQGNGDYDALDRPLNIVTPVAVNGGLDYVGPSLTYDSLDNVLSDTGAHSMGGTDYQVQYQYDSNGRRTQLQPSLNGIPPLPAINYGYDCDDQLVSMSNNGNTLQSCSPSNSVTNGDESTQVAFYYAEAGEISWMASDGVLAWNTGIDADGRVTETDYYSLLQFFPYGTLTYAYDADGRLISKGGTLAAVSLPSSDSATYSPTDQLSTWNGGATNPDHASNITTDPVLQLTYTWNARNQLAAMSPGSVSETYDALGRRETSVAGTQHSLSLVHDGSSVVGSFDSVAGNTWTFLPGGLAGSLTTSSGTTTWVPLLDKDGTTIALVNAANVNSGPETTFTYDPSGVSTVSGLANSFPFLYEGLEHEVSDPGQLYFEPSGNVYNPQIQRNLSLIGPQGIDGPPSGGVDPLNGGSGGHSNSGGGPSNLSGALRDLAVVGGAFGSLESLNSPFAWFPFGGGESGTGLPIPLLSNFLCLINCNSSNGDQPNHPPHETSTTYLILGIRHINGQKSVVRVSDSEDPPLTPLYYPDDGGITAYEMQFWQTLGDFIAFYYNYSTKKGDQEAHNLNDYYAMKEAMSHPEEGTWLEEVPMTDERFPESQGWKKYQTTKHGVVIHYVYNPLTGEATDFKYVR
jgi:YD repeat-containing protein